jgi:hypothetical protein
MILHQGFKLTCDSQRPYSEHRPDTFVADNARTERTAIEHARAAEWFVGNVRVTSGIPKRNRQTVRRVLCPVCRWLVGAM